MNHAAHDSISSPESVQRKPRGWGAALWMVALIGGVKLLRERSNHHAGSWLDLLLLACPLTHLLHGHGRNGVHERPVDYSLRPGQE